MKVGMAAVPVNSRLGPMLFPRTAIRMAQTTGCESVWVADHLNSLWPRSVMTPEHTSVMRLIPDFDAYLEPWTLMGAMAANNRLRRVTLGTGVTDAGRRNPAVTAQAAATLHLLTRGRAILGIGVGEKEGNAPYGVDWSRPVARFIEALATIRALWDSGGELVNRDSEWFPLHNAIFTLPPYKGKWPPIWVAAHGPRTLRATGRYADTWFPVAMGPPETYADGLAQVRAAADDAGRNPATIGAAALFFTVTGRSRDEVDEVLASTAVKAFALNLPAAEWERHGARHPLGDEFSGFSEIIPQVIDEATVLEYTSAVPDSLIRANILNGTPAEVIEQLAAWRDNGLSYSVFTDLSALGTSLRQGLAAELPFAKILREARRL